MGLAKRRVLPKEEKKVGRALARVGRAVRSGDWISGGDRGAQVEALRQSNLHLVDRFDPAARQGQAGRDVLGSERRQDALGHLTGKVDGDGPELLDDKQALTREVWRNLQQAYQREVVRGGPSPRRRQVGELREHRRLDALTARQATIGGLRVGARGRAVANLQHHLRVAGDDPGPVNGEYSSKTGAAVRSFQKEAGLQVTGRVNRQTWDKLRDRLLAARGKASPARAPGAHGAAVKLTELQRQHDPTLSSPGNVATLHKIDDQARELVPQWRRVLERYNRTQPGHNYGRTWARGVQINARTEQLLDRAEYVMRHKYGHQGFKLQLSQGSYSAGTHEGGGAADIRTRDLPRKTVDHMVKALRQAGFAAWSRGRGHDSFAPHIHAIAIGDQQLSWSAREQVSDYFSGLNGLANATADPDGHLDRPIPSWAKRYR